MRKQPGMMSIRRISDLGYQSLLALSLLALSLDLPAITVGEVVNDSIAVAGEVDSFAFDGSDGQELFFDRQSGGTLSFRWSLRDPADNVLFDVSSWSDAGPLILPATGVYSLEVAGRTASNTGDYQFQIFQVPPVSMTPMLVGEVVSSAIGVPGEVDEFTFAASAGQSLYFDRQAGSVTAITWSLVSPAGVVVFTDGSWSDRGPLELTETGTYTLRLDGNGDDTVNYQFQVSSVPATSSTAIQIGEVVNGRIDVSGEVDEFSFAGSADQAVYFDRQLGSPGSITWTLTSATGAEVFTDTTWDDRGPLALPEDGQYTLRMDGNGDDILDYQFLISAVPATSMTAISIGEVVIGRIDVSGEVDEFSFAGSVGQVLYFDRQVGGSGSISWTLHAPDGTQVFTDPNWNDRDPITLDQSGEYRLTIDGNRDDILDYQFQLLLVPPPTTTAISLGEIFAGQVNVPGQFDYFTFDASAGQIISLERLSVGNSGFNWVVSDPLGNQLASSNSLNNIGQIPLSMDGMHRLEIDGRGDITGSYVVRLWDVPADVPVSIALDSPVPGVFAALAQQQTYLFDAVAGQDILLDLNLNQGNRALFDLYGPQGTRIFRNRTIDTTASALPETGEYRLVARTNSATPGYFNFQVASSTVPQPMPAAADLVVSNIVNPLRVIGSPAEFQVSWTVTNQGTAATNVGDWVDQLQFRGEEDFERAIVFGIRETTSATVEATVNHSGVLNPGASYTRTVNISYQPEPDHHGAFQVVVIADARNQVFEDQLEDNSLTASSQTTVYAAPRVLSGDGGISTDLADGSVLPAGQPFSLSGQASLGGGAINVLFVVDVSASTLSPQGFDANGDGVVDELDDTNRDGRIGDILDTEIGAILAITEQMAVSSVDVQVAVVPFSGPARKADLGPGEHTQLFQDPRQEAQTNTGVPDLETAVRSFRTTFGTDFKLAINTAGEVLNVAPDADQTLVFFLTDGESLQNPTEEEMAAFAARGMRFFAYQVDGAELTNSLAALVAGLDASPATSATGTPIDNPNDLAPVLLSSLALAGVNVNGNPVASLDAAGNYFTQVSLEEGPNRFTIEALDSDGNGVSREITLIGAAPGDLQNSRDITGLGELSYRNTRYNRSTRQLQVDAFLTNTGQFPMRSPVQAAFNTLPPAVQLLNGEGLSSTGLPWINFDTELGANGLAVGATSQGIPLLLSNPMEDRFSLEATLLSLGNNAPNFSSVPVVSVDLGSDYQYPAMATDADDDPLVFSLKVAPAGLSVSATGGLDWSPGADQRGVHQVELVVDDGRGGSASQAFQITVTNGLPDLAPAILSAPIALATRAVSYQYAVQALDPEGQPVEFALLDAPAGMAIDIGSGLISFLPGDAEVGTHDVHVQVSDPAGNLGNQRWQLLVRADNLPPVFTSSPPTTVAVGATWRYRAVAEDDGDTVTYSLTTAPAGMSLDPLSGLLRLTPNASQLGNHAVVIRAQDALGAVVEQAFNLEVSEDLQAPTVSVVVSSSLPQLGEELQITVIATDNIGVADLALSVDGSPLSLVNGQASYLAETAGIIDVTGTATDVNGNSGQTTVQLRVLDPSDTTPPVLEISAPSPGTTVAYMADIIGTVSAPDLEYYQLDYARVDQVDISNVTLPDPDWVNFANGTSNVENDLLGSFDATLLNNDNYVVRLLARDTNGNSTSVGVVLGVEGNAKLGQFILGYTDLEIPLAGLPIRIERQYDTLAASDRGEFGFGWRLAMADADIRETIPVHPQEPVSGFFAANAYLHGTRVYLNDPEGRRIGFTFEPETGASLLGTVYYPKFIADPGVFYKLEVDPIALTLGSDGGYQLFLLAFNYNPENFRLVSKDGTTYHYNQFRGLQRVSDRNGNELVFQDSGISHSSGESIQFIRNGDGLISQIIDPQGNTIHYAYDAANNLVSVTDQEGQTTQFGYLADPAHYVSSITDASGRIANLLEYDAEGRIAAQVDALGRRVEQSFDTGTFTGTVRDARGGLTTILYDENGNELQHTDSLGNVRLFTYDADNNQTSITDEEGHVRRFTFDDRGNRLSETDPGGNTTLFSYDSTCNKVAAQTSPLGQETTFAYDANCNLVTSTDNAGTVLSYGYNEKGQRTSISNATGGIRSFTYDARGNVLSMTDLLGRSETYTYDRLGNPLLITDRSGRVVSIDYDRLGRRIRETWDTVPPTVYEFSYNEFDDLTGVIGPDLVMDIEYWDVGMVKSIDYDGTPGAPDLHMLYGIDHGGAITIGYDPNGNLTQVSDAHGGLTEYQYDVLDRLTDIVQRNGTQRSLQLHSDRAGNLQQIRRFAGATAVADTAFTYDCGSCADRINSVVHRRASDAGIIHAIGLNRDAAGRVLDQQDAEGLHTYEYDGLDRLTGAIHSTSAAQVNESYQYDAVGNRSFSHLSNAHVHSYALGEEGNELRADDSYEYEYDANGRLLTRRDTVSGTELRLAYDHRGRNTLAQLVDITGVESYRAEYRYDVFDRRIQTIENGVERWYAFDGLNPVLELDPAGNVLARRLYARKTDSLFAEERGGQNRWLLHDAIGTVRDLLGDDGVVDQHLIYDSFGRLLDSDGAAAPAITFAAREFDAETGLGYYRQRLYLPESGRFNAEDPLFPFLYSYADNNPIRFIDPLGLASEDGLFNSLINIPTQLAKKRAGVAVCKVMVLVAMNFGPVPLPPGAAQLGKDPVAEAVCKAAGG